MGYRPFDFEKETFYHIYNRGYNKQQLFFEDRDYEKFLNSIQKYKERFQDINIIAFCVLPNHFHLILIETGIKAQTDQFQNAEQISKFMKGVQLAYAMFFNTKYGKKGKIIKKNKKLPVFEGRFQARVIEDENYLEYLKDYVEMNAVKHGLVDDAVDWMYSSFGAESKKARTLFGNTNLLMPDDFDPFFE